MRYKCRDCGQPIGEIKRRPIMRDDVCEGCWQNRLDLVSGRITALVNSPEMRAIQRAMANGRGTAKRLIEKAIGQKVKP